MRSETKWDPTEADEAAWAKEQEEMVDFMNGLSLPDPPDDQPEPPRLTLDPDIELALRIALEEGDKAHRAIALRMSDAENAVWGREASVIPVPRRVLIALMSRYAQHGP